MLKSVSTDTQDNKKYASPSIKIQNVTQSKITRSMTIQNVTLSTKKCDNQYNVAQHNNKNATPSIKIQIQMHSLTLKSNIQHNNKKMLKSVLRITIKMLHPA
jgi:hypothetical protein